MRIVLVFATIILGLLAALAWSNDQLYLIVKLLITFGLGFVFTTVFRAVGLDNSKKKAHRSGPSLGHDWDWWI